ncbi:MAG: hypothetical protein FJ221_03265 [Lentisphaerae bacterium]|nr:hypothetical protein [Lentisphaerota bacterium]
MRPGTIPARVGAGGRLNSHPRRELCPPQERRKRMKAWLRWVAMGLACCSVASAREWTSVSGTKLDAEFVRITGDTVTLKKPDGQTLGIRRQLLSAEDQAFIQEQSGAPAASRSRSRASPPVRR